MANIENTSVDRATNEIIEIISSRMLAKATNSDLSTFPRRNLDNRISSESDIEQYKLLHSPLDNRQRYLDVMCFPILFPTGKYGQYHNHEIKLSLSEYLK